MLLGPVAEQCGGSVVEPQRIESRQTQRRKHAFDGARDVVVDTQATVIGKPRGRHQTRAGELRVPAPVVGRGADGPQRRRSLGRGRAPGGRNLGLDPLPHRRDRIVDRRVRADR